MESNNKVKNVILAVLVVGLVGMTIAYAALTQTLVINNNQVTVSSNWKVRFNSSVTTNAGANTTASVETPASITTGSDNTEISGLRATLKKPGDYVTVDFTIQNEGNIAAKAATTNPIQIGTPSCAPATGSADVSGLCDLISYTVTPASGSWDTVTLAASNNGTPVSGGTVQGTLKVELPSNVTAEQMAAYNGVDVVISGLTATFNFIQN